MDRHYLYKREPQKKIIQSVICGLPVNIYGTRGTKEKNPKGDFRLDCFLNVIISHRESSKREEPESDLRLDHSYFSAREPQKGRTRRVTYGWTVTIYFNASSKREESKG